MAHTEKQILSKRYINIGPLTQLLRQLFGPDFTVEDLEEEYILMVPKVLTKVQVASPKNRFFQEARDRSVPICIMEELKDSINGLRQKNYQSRSFIPQGALFQLMQRDKIREALNGKIESYKLQELVENIFKGARKIFAILVLNSHERYITKFIAGDQLQSSQLDYKLPFDLPQLQNLMSEGHAALFHEKQWEFTAPVFTSFVLGRSLQYDTIMPFIKEVKIGSGGFGDVYSLDIDTNHQLFDSSVTGLVRKEMQPHAKDYEIELENLSLLKLLRHPNIIELLGCYTYRDSHNLLFPRATEGDLSKLLKSDRPECFSDNSAFLVALSGLASAIDKVHNFVVDEFQLELTGCHHDLKALNILVDKDRFILADFGLSKFKDTAQDSATIFKTRKGYVLAPECQELEGSFEKHKVHRWSDIWSFGCIMLDVLTYMLRGSKGVSDFVIRRRFQVETNIYYYFHKGFSPHEGVISWIEELEDISSVSEKKLIRLIRRMLEIDPTARPKAIEVDREMTCIALTALSEPILKQYNVLKGISKTSEASVQPYLEEKRFLSWMMSLGLDIGIANSTEPPTSSILDFKAFQSIVLLLQTLRQELGAILNNGTTDIALRVFLPLRRLNTALLDILPSATKAKARGFAKLLILGTNSVRQLDGIQKLLEVQGGDHQISMLAESKKLRLIAEESEKAAPTRSISWDLGKPVKRLKDLGYHTVGLLEDDATGEEVEVLVDYKHYEDPSIQQKLFSRMNEIVQLCQSLQASESIEVLHCRGYFHDESIEAFGLVYDFPSGFSAQTRSQKIKATTLHKILSDGVRSQMPLLVSRYKLAKTLAGYVSELHKIGWVHKGISSSNIAFFYESQTNLLSALQKPYIIGFKHSRPQASFTEGPTSDDREKDYEHPDYSRMDQRYSHKYDYYSLGLVLLEIGLWKTLNKEGALAGLSLTEAREHLMSVKVPRLGQSMGATYRDAVYTCLGHDFDQYDSIEDENARKAAAQLKFETEVLFKLSTLSQYGI